MLYFDIDRFKVVNDSLGHGVGDLLLAKVASRLQRVMRSQDLLARLGGDEFTLLLDRIHGRDEAIAIATRVADAFADPFEIAGRRFNISASIGIATNIDAADDAEALLTHADAAQYRAKERGRNRIEVFDAELRESIAAAPRRRAGAPRRARPRARSARGSNPRSSSRTGRIVGAEALARWAHAERGVLDAGHFVPLAEEAGLVYSLDDTIVRCAVEARAGLAAGGRRSDRSGSGATSRPASSRVPARPSASSGCSSAPAARPTRSGSRSPRPRSFPTCRPPRWRSRRARELGIKVALDDFGTGHSSLTLLRSLPIDRVKIDQTFVRELERDARATAIVRSVITLAKDLGLEVVAEGVETEAQAQVLARARLPVRAGLPLGAGDADRGPHPAASARPWRDLPARR